MHAVKQRRGSLNDTHRYKTFAKHRSLRLRGFDYRIPHTYHLTWGTARRKPLLTDPDLTKRLIEILKKEAKDSGMLLYTYCFMPDHVHLLLCPEEGKDPMKFVQRYKGKTTRIYWRVSRQAKLWQRGFYDHILRGEEDVRQVSRYILENPVRKGMVESFKDYPFSGSEIFTKDEL